MTYLISTLQVLGLRTTQALRRHRGDEGQTSAEYLGIIIVVAAIIVAVIGANIGKTISDALGKAIESITGAGTGG